MKENKLTAVFDILCTGRVVLTLLLCFLSFHGVQSQTTGAKTNLLYGMTSTVNLGLEIGLAPKWTLELPVNYNPWEFGNGRKLKHWLVQPEVRHWLCERFNGHFFGLHAHAAGYNVSGIKVGSLKDYRYEGNLYGAGVSYGYQWILGKRWSLEATIGVGYAYLDRAKYPCGTCESKIHDGTKNYFGPTKAGVSLVYIIK